MMLEGYSAPITRVYADAVDLLLQNIARHFKFAALDREGVFSWEAVKLAELGQLRQENLRIIAQTVGDVSGMAEIALEQSMLDAIKKNEPALYKAVQEGIVAGWVPGLSESMRSTLQFYSAQAAEQFNLVNTVMLTSSENAMRKVISTAAHNQQYLREVSQGALNTATGEVLTGISSRQAAVRGAIGQMAQEGITGFIDKAGHVWSPEAYVDMDVRTTANNVAREAVWQQCDEAGLDLVIVPVNATAREKCRPYQGKVLSRSGQSGYTTDGNGRRVAYMSIYQTTFGQPDGLFGINCHHSPPDPWIPGMSTRVTKPEKDAGERYERTQQQRYYERQVKDAKRAAACYDAAGDTEAFQNTAKLVNGRTDRLKTYCDKAGLKYYPSKVQVFGYGRSTASKATWAVKRAVKRTV